MKKILFFVLFAMGNVLALDTYTVPFIAAVRDTLTKTRYNMNNDTAAAWANRATDTINSLPRWNVIKKGDTTIDTFRVNKIRSNPNIDSISGKVVMDTIQADSVKARTVIATGKFGIGTASPDVDINVLGPAASPASSGTTCAGNLALETTNGNALYFGSYGISPFGSWLQASNRTDLSVEYPLVLNPNGGYVSIGGTTPTSELTVSGTVNASTLLTNYIQFGTTAAPKCSTYIDTTFPDSLFDGTTYRATGSARIVQVGLLVSLYQEWIWGTITAATDTYIKGVPSKFHPSTTINIPIVILNNSAAVMGSFRLVGDGSILIQALGENVLTAGTGGIGNTTVIHWIK